MTKHVRVNIRAAANTAAIRRERRNGRDKIIVPSATLPDDVVMNGIKYPADEIEKGYKSLNRTPAPLGHPSINGVFVSASDPEGINLGWIGAHNENVRRENGRVFLDKVIDVQRANESEGGKAVLAAIEKGDPIHTSTGLFLDLEEATGEGFKHVARNMLFDHDAILLGEEGAATPDQGVGMMVNAKGEQEQVDVINSALDMADQELDWAGMHLLSALERRDRASAWERFKSAIMEALKGQSEREPSADQGEADMADEKQLNELSATVNALSETVDGLVKGLGETITNAVTDAVKPLKDHVDQVAANQKAKDDAELADHVAAIVKANILEEADAKELTLNAARKLAEKAKPKGAAALNGAFGGGTSGDEFEGYDLNANLEGGKK